MTLQAAKRFTVHIILLLTVLLLANGCGKNKEKDIKEDVTLSAEQFPEAFAAGHNARNSLDYAGTYTGLLPAANGTGIETTIIIENDGTCIKRTRYPDKGSEQFEAFTTYVWNDEGNTIMLEHLPPPNSYFVGENYLLQLDIDGNRITGELADSYILRKE